MPSYYHSIKYDTIILSLNKSKRREEILRENLLLIRSIPHSSLLTSVVIDLNAESSTIKKKSPDEIPLFRKQHVTFTCSKTVACIRRDSPHRFHAVRCTLFFTFYFRYWIRLLTVQALDAQWKDTGVW